MYEHICGAWFALATWAWGWKLGAFLVTWTAVSLVVGWVVGSVARLGGDSE
jgi:hypothetical protein